MVHPIRDVGVRTFGMVPIGAEDLAPPRRVLDAPSGREIVWQESNVFASAVIYPRVSVHGTTHNVLAATVLVDKIALTQERLLFAVAQGGNSKVGTFHVIMS